MDTLYRYRWPIKFPHSVTVVQRPVNLLHGQHILWKKSMIQELVYERADTYFNLSWKCLKPYCLEETELCLILTPNCGLTPLHGLCPSWSPQPCPAIPRLCLTPIPLTGPDPEPHVWAHVLSQPWCTPVPRDVPNVQDWGHTACGWGDGTGPGSLKSPCHSWPSTSSSCWGWQYSDGIS